MEAPHFVAYVYRINRVNAIFALSSILLLVFLVWMVWQDFDRDWKRFQRAANRLEIAKTEAEHEMAAQEIDRERLGQLENDLGAARSNLALREGEIEAIQGKVDDISDRFYKADMDFRFAKADYDVLRFEYEEAALHYGEDGAVKEKEELDRLGARIKGELAIAVEQVQEEEAGETKRMTDATADRDEIERQIAAMEKATNRLDRKLAAIGDNFFNTFFRNQPLLDFLAPSEKVLQVVIPGILDDVNFVQVPKVDRCQTCHLNIDRPGYEVDAETGFFQDDALREHMEKEHADLSERKANTRVFATHPNPDLVLGGGSPHPIENSGCTICHLGRGRGTTFTNTAHTPKDVEEENAWEERYGWHKMHYWEHPMLPMIYSEAMCAKCHKGVVDIPKADRLNRGRQLVETLGCFGCHKIGGYEGLRKVGPDLTRIRGKLEPEWVSKWVNNPKDFRPTTKMPRFFHLSNTSEPEDRARSIALINGITAYLFENSEGSSYPPPPVRGNPSRGRELVEKVGCKGCHVVGRVDQTERSYDDRSFGPNLNQIGSKVKLGWLFAWLKDPHDYFPETRMPDLRLTDQEASDIAAYLMIFTNSEFEGMSPERTEDAARDEMAFFYLRAKMTDKLARKKLSEMSVREKDLFLGELAISRQGCYGCHIIGGFEKAQKIGTELTVAGDKAIDRLEFGFIDIPKTRHDWFFQKLKDPRVFDEGKFKAYDEKLRMPNFNLSDEDIHSITMALLSFTKDDVPLRSKKNLSPSEIAVVRGQRLVRDHNCRGCHIIEDAGGAIRPSIAGAYAEEGRSEADALAFSPPVLHGEGAKVQPEWLFEFLKKPTPIRPWLEVRMPTFGFSDGEATDIAKYFSALDNEVFPYETIPEKRMRGREMRGAQKLFSKEYFDCLNCHQEGEKKPLGDPSRWAPDLANARDRLRPKWIADWLRDPQKIQPGTKMPSFFDEMIYLPEEMNQYLTLPEGVVPEDGLIEIPSRPVINLVTDHIVYGMHQN